MAQNQIAGQVILIPQEIFVGDRAQMQFSFKSAAAFPATAKDTSITLEEDDPRLPQSPDCTVTGISVNKTVNGDYSAIISFIPWKTGTLVIPSITFGDAEKAFTVTVPQPFIHSLTEKTQTTSLKPPIPPLLLPGTTYAVYGILLGFVVFLILLITILVKIKAFSSSISSFFEKLKLSRNYKRLKRQLRRLEKRQERYNPQDFAEQLQKILRSYFSGKYLTSFASTTAKESVILLLESGSPATAMERVKTLFTRCDFIRFCAMEEKKLIKDERIDLLRQAAQTALECEHASI